MKTVTGYSEPVGVLSAVYVQGEEVEDRESLRAAWKAGALDEVEFDAVVFRDGPNANGFRFRADTLAAFAASFAGQPFLRDHDTHTLSARDGTIKQSALRGGDFIQRVKLTTDQGVGDFVQGRIDRFSIGWYYDGITCSVCNQEWLSASCAHWPRRTYEVRGEGGKTSKVLCELIFENPRGKETSAVNAPAVQGTGLLAALIEQKQEVCKMDGSNGAPVGPIQAPVNTGADWAAALRRQARDAALAASGLPEAAREAVRAGLGDEFTPDELDGAIERQRAVIAAAQQVVQGVEPVGSGRVSGMRDGLDRFGLAFDALLAGTRAPDGVRPLSGIREAYVLLSGDYDMRGLFFPENVGLSNVNSTTMAGMVANALNKRIVNMFQAYPRWWDKIVSPEDFQTLQEVKWITLGGVGELPTVAEGAAYTEMTWDDQTETASWVKKGGYLGVTLEAIDKDDTRRLQQAPRALAQAAWLTLSKAISAIFTANSGVGPTLSSDSTALFHSNHANLGSTALSLTQWTAVRLAMRKQTELNSAQRLGSLTAPKYLLVPPDLEATGLQILASDLDYTYALSNGPAGPVNPYADGDGRAARLQSARERLIVVDLWTDTNNWAAAADPMMYPSIGLGFRFGREPELFSVADPGSGLMFTNDVMPVKVRWFFATGPTDYRGLYKANVA